MNEEQMKWEKQFWTNFGGRAFFRFSCFVGIWILLAVVLSLFFHSSELISTLLFTAFLVSLFAFAVFSRGWKPAYLFLRKVLGNENLPIEPMPRPTVKIPRGRLPWWGYLLGIWHWFLLLLVLFIVLKWYLQ